MARIEKQRYAQRAGLRKTSEDPAVKRARQTNLMPGQFLNVLKATISNGTGAICSDEAASCIFIRSHDRSPWKFLEVPSLRYIRLPREVKAARLLLYKQEKDAFLDIYDSTKGKLLARKVYDNIANEFVHPDAAKIKSLWRWLRGIPKPRPFKFTLRVNDKHPFLDLKGWPTDEERIYFPPWAKGLEVEVSGVQYDSARKARFFFPEKNESIELVLHKGKLVREFIETALTVLPGETGVTYHKDLPGITFMHGPRLKNPFMVKLNKENGSMEKITYFDHDERNIPFRVIKEAHTTFVMLDKRGISYEKVQKNGLSLTVTDLPVQVSTNKRSGPIPYVTVFDKRFSLEKPRSKRAPIISARRSFFVDARISQGHVIQLDVRRMGQDPLSYPFVAVRDYVGRILGTSREGAPSVLFARRKEYLVECWRSCASPYGTQYLDWSRKKFPLGVVHPERQFCSFVIGGNGAIFRVDLWPDPVRDPYVIEANGFAPKVKLKEALAQSYNTEQVFQVSTKKVIQDIFFHENRGLLEADGTPLLAIQSNAPNAD